MDPGESITNVAEHPTIRKLPPGTRRVYERLVSIAEDGLLQATTAELARVCNVHRSKIVRHLSRLRDAGLLFDLRPVPIGDRGSWCRLRRVVTPKFAGELAPSLTPRDGSKPRVQTHRVGPNPGSNDSFLVLEKNETRTLYPKGLSDSQDAQPSGVDTRSLRDGFAVSAETLHRFADAGSGETMNEATVDNELENLMDAGQGERRAFDLNHLPPYPGADRFPSVHVPKMPRFSGNAVGDAKLLIRAYKAVCHRDYGKKPRVDRASHFRMRAAAKALRAAGVKSPFAWAAFRMVQWGFSERASSPPTIDYVFSANVVENHVAQYKRKASSYDVLNRVLLTPSHDRLLRLWESCRRACSSPTLGESGEAVTRAACAGILPDELYKMLADKIPSEHESMLADIYKRMANGEWIW